MERMSDEEAREMVSPELRDLADRRGWAIKGFRVRLRVTQEVLEKIRADRRVWDRRRLRMTKEVLENIRADRRVWHWLEQEAERGRRERIREVNRHRFGSDE